MPCFYFILKCESVIYIYIYIYMCVCVCVCVCVFKTAAPMHFKVFYLFQTMSFVFKFTSQVTALVISFPSLLFLFILFLCTINVKEF